MSKKIRLKPFFGLFFALFAGMFLVNLGHAQQVSGVVTDEGTGESLPGVNVVLKGTSQGTATGPEGSYSLEVPSLQDTLVFSFVGYQRKEVPINGRSTINVELTTQAVMGQEMVVVGYGTQRKENLTGSISSVSSEDIGNQTASSNPAYALQGKLPGLKVKQSSGEPGNEGLSLQLRGLGTFSSADTEPLVIIDGIPGDINSLNPQDIADITVLKDAASASIYGARAANGVVLVTTKSGSSQDLQIQYDFSLGIHQPTRMLDLVTNSAEYMRMYNQALARNGLPAAYPQSAIDQYANATDREQYPNTDWVDIMFNPAYVSNHYLGVSGGNERTTYKASLGYLNQPGVMKGFTYDKYTLQFNLDSDVTDFITFGSDLNLRYGDRLAPRQGANDTFLATLSQAPMYRPSLPDGSGRYTYNAYPYVYHNKNPVAIAENVQAQENTYGIQGNISLDIDLLENLSWRTKGGLNFSFFQRKDFRPEIPLYNYLSGDYATTLDVGGAGMQMDENNTVYPTIFTQLTYQNDWQDHSLKVLGGAQQEHYKNEWIGGFRRDYPNNRLHELDAGGENGQEVYGSSIEWSLRSLFGRINYSYKDRYLLELNARYDGSSRFAEENRWGFFPSFSAGWRISEEPFMSSLDWLSELKLRGSWGQLGNQEIGVYPYQTVLNLGANYPFDYSSLSPGARPSGLVDKSIKWETTEITDIGFDLSVFEDKFTVTADWFKKKTFDILRGAQIPTFVGLDAPTINQGQMENTGFEFSTEYRNNVGDFQYSVGGNISMFNNELVKYGARQINDHTINQEGKPWNAYYMYDWIGIFQSEEEVQNSPQQPYNPQPGDLKFRDVNGDGKITPEDRTFVGGTFPDFTYGIHLSAAYKNFDANASFYGVQGQKRYVRRWGIEPFFQSAPPTTDWKNAWTPENKTNEMPALYWADWSSYPAIRNMPNTFFLKNASYFRLKNLTIGYNFSQDLLNKIGAIRGLRVYFTGQNLLTITDYPYLDPEQTEQFAGFVSYPQNKVYSFGIQMEF